MATLDRDDIENIADAVVRRLNLQPVIDTQRIAETLPLKERQAFWRGQRSKEKSAKAA